MTVGAQIAELVVPSDAFGTPTHAVVDWVNGRAFLFNTTAVRNYLTSLTTQNPITSANFTGTSYLAVGDADPTTGAFVTQAASSDDTNQPIQTYDPTALTLTGSYGVTSNSASYPTGIGKAAFLICVGCGTVASAGATQVGYSLQYATGSSGSVTVVRLDNMTQAGFAAFVVSGGGSGNSAIGCRGASSPTKGSAFFTWDGAGSLQNSGYPLYVVTIAQGAETYDPTTWPATNPYITHSTVGTVAASAVDAAWTTLQVNAIGYDSSDGNVLMDVTTTNSVTNKHYLVKVNSTTAAVIWATVIGGLSYDPAASRINGLMAGLTSAPVADVFTTQTGALATTALTGLSGLQFTSSDDTYGLIFSKVTYAQGAGNPTPVSGTPTSFTGWAIITGTSLPAVPLGLAVGNPTRTALTAVWVPGAGVAPISYTLQYRTTGTSPWTQISGITILSDIVTGLVLGTEYDFQVEAVGGDGASGFTATVSAWTLRSSFSAADVFFSPTAAFFDLSISANRRKFLSATGGAWPLGSDGSSVLGASPAVFLHVSGGGLSTTADTFAANNGVGGTFVITNPDLQLSAINPPGVQSTGPGGSQIVGDYRNGNIYSLNLDQPLDNGTQRRWLRRWRALVQPDPNPHRFVRLTIQMETGAQVPDGTAPQIELRWSDDGGHTWSNRMIAPAGPPGATAQRVFYTSLGSTRRNSGLDRIFELSSSSEFKVAIISAELEP